MSIGASVELHGFDQLAKALKMGDKRMVPVANKFLDRLAVKIMQRAKRDVPVDRGRLRNSITVDARKDLERRVGSNVKYAKPVEFGRRRGSFPPRGALQPWARRHGFPAGPGGDFLVRRAIAENGIEPRPYLNPAAEEVYQRDMNKEFRDFSASLLDQFVKDIER